MNYFVVIFGCLPFSVLVIGCLLILLNRLLVMLWEEDMSCIWSVTLRSQQITRFSVRPVPRCLLCDSIAKGKKNYLLFDVTLYCWIWQVGSFDAGYGSSIMSRLVSNSCRVAISSPFASIF